MKQTRFVDFASTWLMLFLILATPLLSGCAAALLAGGAIGGYAVAKDMEDGELIDTPKKENKGWFGGK